MPVEFTEEQKKEIAAMIKRQSELEQFRLAGDQFHRLALVHIAGLVNQGACDPFVLNVGKSLYQSYLAEYFPRSEPAAEPAPTDGAEDEGTTD